MSGSTFLPGRTVGIVGGGQLGRMFAIKARQLGYRVHALEATRDCPAGQIADVEVIAPYDDLDAARRFATGVDVVTFEFENVPAKTLAAIETLRPVRPSPAVLDICRHRLREKEFLSAGGFPLARFRPVRSADDLARALEELGTPAVLKTADFGYDGKGQIRIDDKSEAAIAFASMGRPVGVLEAFVRFRKEISVIVARTASRETRTFDVVENLHARHILDLSLAPADVPAETARRAEELALAIADALDVVGVLAVEMFLLDDEEILVNELAPRPHNSGHHTFDSCVTSQFEQQLRAVCGLPLGDPSSLAPAAAMANLLGDLWTPGEPDWAAALALADVKLHLYGKAVPQPGRKMGHLTAMAGSRAQARERVLAARSALAGRSAGTAWTRSN